MQDEYYGKGSESLWSTELKYYKLKDSEYLWIEEERSDIEDGTTGDSLEQLAAILGCLGEDDAVIRKKSYWLAYWLGGHLDEKGSLKLIKVVIDCKIFNI